MGALRMYTPYDPESSNVLVNNNIAAGSEGYGFGIPHVSCDKAAPVESKTTGFFDNVASHAIAGFMFSEDKTSKC